MSKLKIADDLSLPLDVTTQAIGWLGRRGSGKSYGASKLAELLHDAGAQFVAVDPVGIWYGLRVGADKSSAGLDVPIFGGLHGDIPLEAGAGTMIADLVVDRGISCVLDVSQFESDSDKARFARDFAARFFFRKKASPSAVHVFVEEAQEFIPQNIQRGEEQMLHAWQRLVRLGRNYGIGVSMISQRPQDVNKKALNQVECLFCFQLTGPQERDAVEGWVSDKGLSDDLGKILPNLKVGCPHVWSPVWLDINREVHIAAKRTFAAGTTPKVGERPVAAKPLAPMEMEKIRKDMAATIEKAKENDPALLKKRIAELERLMKARPAEQVEKIVEKEVPVLKNGQLDRTEKIADRLAGFVEKFTTELTELRRLIAPAAAPRPVVRTVPARAPVARPVTTRESGSVIAEGGLTGPEQKILNAIAWMNSIGVDEPEQAAVAFVAGYTIGGGAFNNPRGALNSKGLVEYRPKDCIRLTDTGRALATVPNEEITNSTLQQKVLDKLPGPEGKILQPLLAAYPSAIHNEELARLAGYSAGGGAYNNPRGRLRTLGLVEYRDGGVAARSILFPEG
jgi:uncharacterized protein